jgi:hypothetical protein
MQNANYFGMVECKMPKFLGSCLVPSKIQNLLSHESLLRIILGFFGLLRPKSKMENNHRFAKIFAWCLVPFCKMMDQNPKFFGKKGELNIPLIGFVLYVVHIPQLSDTNIFSYLF